MGNPQPASATPILDSAVRPKARGRGLGSTLLGVLLGVPFALVLIESSNRAREARNPAADSIFLFYLVGFVLVIVVHEAGHLVAGLMVGFRFNSFVIGPLSLRLEYGRLKFQLRRTLPAGGYAGMHVDRVRRLRRRLLVFIAAGPAVNLLSVAAAVAVRGFFVTGWSAVALNVFWQVSLMIGLINLLPFRLGMLFTDGARITMLLSSRAKARRWLSIAAVGSQSHAGVRPKSWRRTWLEAAGTVRDGSIDDFAGNWTAYAAANDRNDAATAAPHLERCLELSVRLGPSLQDVVAIEAAVFTAWFRGDPETAQKWLGQIKKLKAVSQLLRQRADIALCCARRDYPAALARWQGGFDFIEKLPPTPMKKRLMEGFNEWRDEILERQSRESAAALSIQPVHAGSVTT